MSSLGLGDGAVRIHALRGKDGRSGVALLVRVLEETRSHDALPIDDERAGMRNTIRAAAWLRLLVQDAEAPDDRRSRISDQREPDAS
jgi:hypothetical protein